MTHALMAGLFMNLLLAGLNSYRNCLRIFLYHVNEDGSVIYDITVEGFVISLASTPASICKYRLHATFACDGNTTESES